MFPSNSTIKNWAAELMRRSGSVEAFERSWHPKEATTDETVEHNLIMCDRRRSLRYIARHIGISFGTVQSILTDLSFFQGII